jgi:hypothetical protein
MRVRFQHSIRALDSGDIMLHGSRWRNLSKASGGVPFATGVTMRCFLVNRRTRLANLISILEGVSLV